MNQQKQLVKNTLIIAFGKLSTQFLTFLLLPLYTAHLSASDYGTVDLILTYVILLTPMLSLSLDMGVFRFLIDARGNQPAQKKIVSTVIRMVGMALLLFTILYFFIGLFITIPYSLLAFGVISAGLLSNLLLQFARGFGDNVKYSIASVIIGVVTILVNIVALTILNMGASGMLIAAIVANAIGAIYLFLSLRINKYIDINAADKELTKDLLRYSLPLVPNSLSLWLVLSANRTLIATMLDLAANGIFAVANKFPIIFSGLFSFYYMSWTESASVNINSYNRDEFFSKAVNASIRLFGSFALCFVAVLPFVFNLMVDAKYNESYLYIPILLFSSMLSSLVASYGAIYIAKKMTKKVLISSTMAAVISLGLTVLLTPFIGLFGPSIAMVVAYLAMTIHRYFDIKKHVTINYDKSAILTVITAYILVSGLYYINNPALSILNMTIALVFSVALNRSMISIIQTKLFARLRPLTPDQQILEEIEEKKL